jgi:hypothetical protein
VSETVLDCKAVLPTATLLEPVVTALKDAYPIAVLYCPVVIASPAVPPKATF